MNFTLNSSITNKEAQLIANDKRAGRYLGVAIFPGQTYSLNEEVFTFIFRGDTKNEWFAINVSVAGKTTVSAISYRKGSKKEFQSYENKASLVHFVDQGVSIKQETVDFLNEENEALQERIRHQESQYSIAAKKQHSEENASADKKRRSIIREFLSETETLQEKQSLWGALDKALEKELGGDECNPMLPVSTHSSAIEIVDVFEKRGFLDNVKEKFYAV